jgi:hypothetical protein
MTLAPDTITTLTELVEQCDSLDAVITECWTRHADLTVRIDDILDGHDD